MFGIRTSELIPLKREIGRGQKSAPNHPGKTLMTRLMTGAEGVDGVTGMRGVIGVQEWAKRGVTV